MKKVLFVLALVAAYGVSIAMSNASVVSAEETAIVVVDSNDKVEKEEGKKEKSAEATKAKGEGCSGSEAKASSCSGEKTAKTSECSEKKSSDCSSSCKTAKK